MVLIATMADYALSFPGLNWNFSVVCLWLFPWYAYVMLNLIISQDSLSHSGMAAVEAENPLIGQITCGSLLQQLQVIHS